MEERSCFVTGAKLQIMRYLICLVAYGIFCTECRGRPGDTGSEGPKASEDLKEYSCPFETNSLDLVPY